MSITKVAILTTMAVSLSFAKVDFVNFGDICEKTSTQSCKNRDVEIKTVQYLLKKRFDASVTVNGKLDNVTKNAIIALQRKENIPASGYIGKKTKDALNKLLYGHKLHDSIAKVDKKETKHISNIKAKKEIASTKVKKSLSKKVATKSVVKNKKVKLVKADKKVKTNKKIVTKNIAKKIATSKIVKNKKLVTTKINSKKLVAKNLNKKRAINKVVESKKLATKKLSNKKLVATKVNTKKVAVKKANFNSYREFVKSVNLRKSYAVYKDPKLLKRASGKNTLLKVDVRKQRVKLVVNGKVALDAPCTTGAKRKFEPNTRTYRDKHTPTGTFKIMEKIALKRSTIFGDIYRNGKLIYHGDRRKYRGSWSGAKFVGHPLKNWMRLTSGGIGLHASKYVKRYPGSNGCIRLQPKVASTIFRKIKPGTKVKVYN